MISTDLWLGNCSLTLSRYQASSGAGLPPLTSQRSCTSSPSLTTRFPGPDTSGGPGGSEENIGRKKGLFIEIRMFYQGESVCGWLWQRTVDGELDPPLHGVVLEGAVLGHAADGGAVIRGGGAELERVDRVPSAGADALGHLVGVLWNMGSC